MSEVSSEQQVNVTAPRLWRRTIIQGSLLMLVTLMLFIVIEGFSSIVLVTYNATKPIAARRAGYTRHDPFLGWVAKPNVTIPDAFGKGVYIRTNSRGFRSNREFQADPSAGELRVICSGDSFTFGVGVDNDDAWCQQLAKHDARLETINMGQTGYGIDQAYLWYLRDGAGLRHDVHLFAFIGRDYPRMGSTDFLDYAKPMLAVKDGRLVVRNTPVPEVSWSRRLAPLRALSSLQLFQRVVERLNLFHASAGSLSETDVRALAMRVFEELQTLDQRENRLLVLVYLPLMEDYRPDLMNDDLREFLRRESARRGIFYVDLTDDFRKLDRHDAEDLFIREKAPWPTIGVWGHYNVAGNRFAASEIYRALTAHPDFARRLQELSRPKAESYRLYRRTVNVSRPSEIAVGHTRSR